MTVIDMKQSKLATVFVCDDHVHTFFYDGSEVEGWPPADDGQFSKNCEALGYVLPDGTVDPVWGIIGHELAHTWSALRFDNSVSYSVWNQAHDKKACYRRLGPLERVIVNRDEHRTTAIEAALNGVEWGRARVIDLLKGAKLKDLDSIPWDRQFEIVMDEARRFCTYGGLGYKRPIRERLAEESINRPRYLPFGWHEAQEERRQRKEKANEARG